MSRESDRYGTTEIQRALLPMLKDFDTFCSRNQIQYSLDGGNFSEPSGIMVLFPGMMM